MLAQDDLLLTDRWVRARIRIDLMTHKGFRRPTPLAAAIQPSRLQDDRGREDCGRDRPRTKAFLDLVEGLGRYQRLVLRLAEEAVPAEDPRVHWIVKDSVDLDHRPTRVAFGAMPFIIQLGRDLLEGLPVQAQR